MAVRGYMYVAMGRPPAMGPTERRQSSGSERDVYVESQLSACVQLPDTHTHMHLQYSMLAWHTQLGTSGTTQDVAHQQPA
jgi:hypothetical protein